MVAPPVALDVRNLARILTIRHRLVIDAVENPEALAFVGGDFQPLVVRDPRDIRRPACENTIDMYNMR